MTALSFGKQGLPLHVIALSEKESWLATQADYVGHFIQGLNPKAGQLVHLPSPSGDITAVVYFVKALDDFWVCGDLAKSLPEGQYQLTIDQKYLSNAALSYALGAYQFSGYKSEIKNPATVFVADEALVAEVKQAYRGVSLVRDLVNTPAADMMPQHLSEVMRDLASEFNGNFEEIVADDLLEQNYPTIHLVGRASENVPRLLDLTWGDKSHPLVTLVGKGVCFDSGGLDLKPAAGMRYMKKDMGGAAHVIGLAAMIMAANLPIRMRVLVPAVENAVSRNAFRPGDVVKTRDGMTVEIDNTDAEGRLVLCDAITEAQNDDMDLMIDFATLTGACRVALGTELPGFFATDDAVANALCDAGNTVSDPVWRMPLFEQYADMLKSDVADISNCATSGMGGAITAALYLKAFVKKPVPWVHFDIMAYNTRSLPGRPQGGEAMGVRAVFEMLRTRYN